METCGTGVDTTFIFGYYKHAAEGSGQKTLMDGQHRVTVKGIERIASEKRDASRKPERPVPSDHRQTRTWVSPSLPRKSLVLL